MKAKLVSTSGFCLHHCELQLQVSLLFTVITENISSCLKTNKCPGLCVMSPEGAKCLCADGLIAKNCIRSYENNTLIGCAKGN